MGESTRDQDRSQLDARNDVENIASVIRGAVADPKLAEVIVRRVALMASDGMISRGHLREIVDRIAQGRRAGTIKNPGGYFVACAKDLFAKAGIPWSAAGE